MYANPLPDEAYYWLWSKNLSLSYFDHPPLAYWSQALIFFFASNKYFVIRALPVLSLVTVLTIMVVWQRQMYNRLDFGLWLKSIVLFLAFPIYSIFFSISFPDFLLITLLFGSSFCLFLYFERDNKAGGGMHYWYLAVLLFSLALLTKYNAILFGAGLLAYIVYSKKKVNSPSYGHIITSIFFIATIQTPVIFWNLNNDFASFSFHLNERLDEGKDLLTVTKNALGFLAGALIAFSPIFIFNLIKNFSIKLSDDRQNFFNLSKFVLLFSVTFCFFLSFLTNVLYYWLTPGFVLLTPFLVNILRFKIWQYLHIFYGILFSLILVINISIYPISAFFGNVDRETAITFGWEKIIEAIDKEKKYKGVEKVLFSDYRLGSLYIFHSGDFNTDVVMEERKTQFDIWRKKDKQFSTKTLIVTDHDFPIGQKILSNFQSIQFVRDIDVNINEKFIKKYQVFLGTKG